MQLYDLMQQGQSRRQPAPVYIPPPQPAPSPNLFHQLVDPTWNFMQAFGNDLVGQVKGVGDLLSTLGPTSPGGAVPFDISPVDMYKQVGQDLQHPISHPGNFLASLAALYGGAQGLGSLTDSPSAARLVAEERGGTLPPPEGPIPSGATQAGLPSQLPGGAAADDAISQAFGERMMAASEPPKPDLAAVFQELSARGIDPIAELNKQLQGRSLEDLVTGQSPQALSELDRLGGRQQGGLTGLARERAQAIAQKLYDLQDLMKAPEIQARSIQPGGVIPGDMVQRLLAEGSQQGPVVGLSGVNEAPGFTDAWKTWQDSQQAEHPFSTSTQAAGAQRGQIEGGVPTPGQTPSTASWSPAEATPENMAARLEYQWGHDRLTQELYRRAAVELAKKREGGASTQLANELLAGTRPPAAYAPTEGNPYQGLDIPDSGAGQLEGQGYASFQHQGNPSWEKAQQMVHDIAQRSQAYFHPPAAPSTGFLPSDLLQQMQSLGLDTKNLGGPVAFPEPAFDLSKAPPALVKALQARLQAGYGPGDPVVDRLTMLLQRSQYPIKPGDPRIAGFTEGIGRGVQP